MTVWANLALEPWNGIRAEGEEATMRRFQSLWILIPTAAFFSLCFAVAHAQENTLVACASDKPGEVHLHRGPQEHFSGKEEEWVRGETEPSGPSKSCHKN